MKKRNWIGLGAAAVLLAVLLPFFGGFGTGDGTGEGTGDGTATSETQATVGADGKPLPPVDRTQEESVDVVDILIDDTTYLVRQADGTRKPIPLDEVAAMVSKARGNSDGYKARIARKESSVLHAETSLEKALVEAKVETSAIRWIAEPVK